MNNQQLNYHQMLAICCIVFISSFLRSGLVNYWALDDSWIAVIIAAAFFIPVTFIYVSLANHYPSKNLFEIDSAIFGKYIGRAVNILYLFFFSCILALTLYQLTTFISLYLLNETPVFVISGFIMAGVVYVTSKGIEPIVNVSTIASLLTFFGVLMNITLSIRHANFLEILPILDKPLYRYTQSSFNSLALDYGEMMIVMMFLGKAGKGLNVKKLFFTATLITMSVLVVLHIREIITAGILTPHVLIASYESIRMIEFGSVLTRIEAVSAVLWVGVIFIKTCIVFQTLIEGLIMVTDADNGNRYILSLAVFFAIYAMTCFSYKLFTIEMNISAFVWTTFEIAVPLLSMVVMYAKIIFQSRQKAV
jgi:spore germination protein KB